MAITEIPPNLVKVASSTTGTGSSVALGAATASNFLTPSEAGMVNNKYYDYVIFQGSDVEIQLQQQYSTTGPSIGRGTPAVSKVGGTAGTTKITLDGSQIIVFAPLSQSISNIFSYPNIWYKPQAAYPAALSSGAGGDFTSSSLFTANVNGSTFTISNPSTDAADNSIITIVVTFTTANALAFGSKFKVAGYAASSSGKDVLVFMRDTTADLYYLVGMRNGVNS